ncbi:MAG: hypothetical protein HY924_14075 [Elusimicrobia bacterium]|nr:hypothetical protein [Elusimicrobiota bacterium]
MTRNERGSVMVHVLVTSVIMGILAAGMMTIVLMQYRLIHRQAYGSMGEKYDEMALSMLVSFWGANQTVCQNMAGSHTDAISYTCSGTPGSCPCTCTPSNSFYPVITVGAAGADGSCSISAAFERLVP